MPTIATGPSTEFLVGFESTEGVLPGTPPADRIRVSNLNLSPNVAEFTDEGLDGTVDAAEWVGGKVGADGGFDITASRESLGFALKAFFGPPTTYGATGFYDHYFKFSTTMAPSFYAQQGHLDIGTYLLYLGNHLGSWRQQWASQGLMKSSFTTMGTAFTPYSSSQISGTITDRTGSRTINYVSTTWKEGGSVIAYGETADFTIDQKLEAVLAMDGTRNRYKIIRGGKAMIDVTFNAHYLDNTLITKGINETETSLEVLAPAVETGHGLKGWFPVGKYLPTGINASGQGKLGQQLRGKFYLRGAASDTAGEVLSSAATTYTIGSGTTDSLQVKIDGGSTQTFTLTAGSRTPAQIVTDINATLTGGLAAVENGRVVIRSTTLGTAGSVQVLSASTADTPLGFHNSVVNGFRASCLFRLSNAVASYA